MPIEFVTGLALAAVSALVIIAYKHPTGFKRIYWPITGLGLLAMMCETAYSIGLSKAFRAAIPFLPIAKTAAADEAIKSLAPDGGTVLLVYIIFLAFMSVLLWLPEILALPESGQSAD